MQSIHQWLSEYGESHQNQTNKVIHWICVPLIFWSILALFASIPANYLKAPFPADIQPYIHWGTVIIALASIFYLRLSLLIFIGTLLFALICLQLIYWVTLLSLPLWATALIIFVAAWIGQFIGHNIEGKKPSFFKDLQFLLIGPAWLLAFIYKRAGIKY